jgi:hypothetical protein
MHINRELFKKVNKIVVTVGTLFIPFVIVLTVGIVVQSLTPKPVANAMSAVLPSSETAPILPNDTLANAAAQFQEIPNESFISSSANDITFYAGNFRRTVPSFDDLKNQTWLSVDLCYDLIDNGDWIIGHTYLVDSRGHSASWAGTDAVEIRLPPVLIDGKQKQRVIIHHGQATGDNEYRDAVPNQTTGQRCDTVSYSLSPGFDLTQFTVVVDYVVSPPREGDECSGKVMEKLQEILDQKGTGIVTKLKVDQGEGGGACGVEIIQIPDKMSEEEARSIVFGHGLYLDLYGIQGPWIFEGSIK